VIVVEVVVVDKNFDNSDYYMDYLFGSVEKADKNLNWIHLSVMEKN
jgi:hypothetical protein